MAGPEGYQYPQPSNPLVIPVPTEPPTEPPPSLEYLPPVEYLPPIDTSSSDNFDSLLLAEPAERQPQVAEMTKSEMEMLLWDYKESIPGLPETDYPILERIPETGFSCDNRLTGFIRFPFLLSAHHIASPDLNIELNLFAGYYADVDTRCQVFHVCTVMPEPLPAIKNSFLCPNGTMFNQENFACQWWVLFHRLGSINMEQERETKVIAFIHQVGWRQLPHQRTILRAER